jgi:hypothetical protein
MPDAPSSAAEPFIPQADAAALEDLRGRLRATRWPDAPEEAGWSLGTDLGYLRVSRTLAVDPGLVVDPVHSDAPDPPRSPDLPRNWGRFAIFVAYAGILQGRVGCDGR